MGQPIKIYVGNIPQSARNSELKELFEKFGKVVECDILKEFAFVHMEDTNDAKAAIAGLNDSLWKGARIRVELSTTKTSKGEPSMRHRMASDDLSRSLRRRSHERDRRGSPPAYMRGGRDARGYDSRFGPMPYRSSDMRGPMRDSRYGGPPPRSRPYPDAYDRRGYPEPRGGPLTPRGGYPPEYPFHPSSYREPMRDHRGAPGGYADPYGRPPMGSHYGQPMPYYRGPPPMSTGSRYDYPAGYPASRPSRYSPPLPARDMYRGMSPRSASREQPTFNGHRDRSPRHMSPGVTSKKRHHSSRSPSRSVSPAVNRRNGNHRNKEESFSRSPSPFIAKSRNGYHKNDRSSSRSQSPNERSSKPYDNGNRRYNDDRSSSRSPSPVVSKTRPSRRKSKDVKTAKANASSGSSSNNSSITESSINHNRRANKSSNGHSAKESSKNKDTSISPAPPTSRSKKSARHKRAPSSSPSRSRSRSSNHSPVKA